MVSHRKMRAVTLAYAIPALLTGVLFPVVARAAFAFQRDAPALPTTAGLKLWLEADALVGLPDGSPVAFWPDSSGSGYAAAQPTASQRPVYHKNVLNGHPAVRFDGLDDIVGGTAPGLQVPDNTIFIVTKLGGDVPATRPILGNGDASDYLTYCVGVTSLNRVISIHQNAATDARVSVSTSGLDTIGFKVLTYSRRLDGANVTTKMWANGNDLFNTTYTDGHRLHDGRSSYELGGYTRGAAFYAGEIAEVLFYDATLSDADRRAVEAYLSTKYGIAVAS